MQPGLSRALPMGILGFLAGVALLLIIRALQSLDPVLDTELALIMGAIFCAGFFVWGMGAFDPRMSEHAHEPHEDAVEQALALAADPPEEDAPPAQILGGYVWQVTTLVLVTILIIATVAFLPTGLTLQTVAEAEGNTAAIGFAQWQLFGETLIVSELVILIGFVIFMVASMAAIAGVLGLVLFSLSRGVTEVRGQQMTALPPAPLEQNPSPAARAGFWALFLVVFVALFALFYFVLIGIILGDGLLNLMLSLGQALPLTFILLRPRATANAVGRAAGWLAKQLRRLPNGLQ